MCLIKKTIEKNKDRKVKKHIKENISLTSQWQKDISAVIISALSSGIISRNLRLRQKMLFLLKKYAHILCISDVHKLQDHWIIEACIN